MAESEFSKSVEDIIATLIDMYRHQNKSNIVDLLEAATAQIEQIDYDNWNGGRYLYELMLEVPVSVFVKIEPNLTKIEKDIGAKLSSICRNLANEHLESVSITPLTSKSTSIGPKAKPVDAEVEHIWQEDFFRLFLSHTSSHKVAVVKLKNSLQLRGISAFVAHEDIIPSLEWQNEIELALRSTHALAALLTDDFHNSNWTDQEVGFALGRGVLVIPIRFGLEPYGFVGKVQGLSGSLDQFNTVADLLVSTLLSHPLTHKKMKKAVINAFKNADSFSCSITLSKVISNIKDFTEQEKVLIQRACKENNQVFKATGVVSRIYRALNLRDVESNIEEDDLPF